MAALADLLSRAVGENLGVDLHAHSRHSDGAWQPAELVADSWQQGVRVMALTDHDTVAGQIEALGAAWPRGMLAITGIEVTTHLNGRAFHILCYDFDPEHPAWERVREHRRLGQRRHHLACFEAMRQQGYELDPQSAMDERGEFLSTPVARAMVAAGRSTDVSQAQSVLRGLNLPPLYEAVALQVARLGEFLQGEVALCSVAHPGREERQVSNRLRDEDLDLLQDCLPLAALEAHHPYHRAEDVAHYTELARRRGLAITCGSDAHGWNVRRPPRPMPAATCRDFLALIEERWRRREPAYLRGVHQQGAFEVGLTSP